MLGDWAPVAADQVPALLARLADESLLVPTSTPLGTRYGMLETIRQYGTALLDDAAEAETARERHLGWCLTTAEQLGEPVLTGPEGEAWRARFDEISARDTPLPAVGATGPRPAGHGIPAVPADGGAQPGPGPARRGAAALRARCRSSHPTTRRERSRSGRRRARPTGASSGTSRSACARWPPTRPCGPVTVPAPPWISPVRQSWSVAVRASWRSLRPPARASGSCRGRVRWPRACRLPRARILTAEAFALDELDPQASALVDRALVLARRAGDPLAESAALDALPSDRARERPAA